MPYIDLDLLQKKLNYLNIFRLFAYPFGYPLVKTARWSTATIVIMARPTVSTFQYSVGVANIARNFMYQ